MRRPAVVVALWLAFTFVAWNVIFDRLVWTAATEFTREQVVRHQQGNAVTSIHDGFSPRVRDAAVQASVWTTPIVATGAILIFFSFRRVR